MFCQVPRLEQIFLGDNRLMDFDFRIDCLPELRYIDLERNMIFRYDFVNCVIYLKVFWCGDINNRNWIQSVRSIWIDKTYKAKKVCDIFEAIYNTSYFSRLTDEAMTRLDAFSNKKGSVLEINMKENPFACDCRSEAFIHWLNLTKINVTNSLNYTCFDGYPRTNIEKRLQEVGTSCHNGAIFC